MNNTRLFSYAFRPLFALLAVHGVLIVPYWALAWTGMLPLPSITVNPTLWHGHEMLFGFSGAAIAGFLLTAVANWSKRAPIAGLALLLLCALWLLARLLWSAPQAAVLPYAAAADLAFNLLLTILFAREVLANDNRRNLKIVGVLLLYTGINAGFYLALSGGDPVWWLNAALYLITLLITIIGGRVIPNFTGNWLRSQAIAAQSPPAFNRLDLAVTLFSVAFFGAALMDLSIAGPLGIAAGGGQLLRLARWQGWRTMREPLLWSLHLGYAWLAIGLLLQGGAFLNWLPRSAGLHALTVGAIGGLILAMSSRAALGHTGRALTSHPLLTGAFVSINIAAAARVLAALLPTLPLLLSIAALAWAIALCAYALRYLPILLGPPITAKN